MTSRTYKMGSPMTSNCGSADVMSVLMKPSSPPRQSLGLSSSGRKQGMKLINTYKMGSPMTSNCGSADVMSVLMKPSSPPRQSPGLSSSGRK